MNSLPRNKSGIKRFTKSNPCPICGGYQEGQRGTRAHCYGFLSDDGKYAHCTRREFAGALPMNSKSNTFAHRLEGPCKCGHQHGPARYESFQARNNNGKREVVARYDYLDEKGELLIEVCRMNPKGFYQQRPDGAGNWIMSLEAGDYYQAKNGNWFTVESANKKGWTIPLDATRKTFPAARRVLYRLPQLLKADPSEILFITEGEKDAEWLELIGCVATCNPEGAGKWHHVAEQARKVLAGRPVTVLPDNDDPGRDHAEQVARSLHGAAASLKVINLPGLDKKGDIADWIEKRLVNDGMSTPDIKAALLDIVNAAPEWTPPADTAPPGSAETAQAMEPPLPLVRVIEPAKPYPVDALGPILGQAAQAIQRATKAPLAMCGNSVLAAATLAVQPHADVEIDGRVFPLSNFYLTVGTTGERKTAVDDLALFPHKEIQDTRTDEYKREKKLFEKEMEIYKKAKDKALQKNKERNAMREAVEQLGDPPKPPRSPLLLLDDPTIEGLLKHYHDLGCSSLGIFSGEGARFLGGYGMNAENLLKTAGGLSDLWGGKPLNRIRAGDGTVVVRGRRLSIHLMAQPNVAALLLDNLALEEQGLLPRFLIVWPESTCGTRTYEAFNAHNTPEFQQYRQRIKAILDAPLPFREDSDSELQPRRIRLSADAKEAYVQFHDGVEEQIREGEELHPIKGIACKAAEHAARLAAVMELTNDLDTESVRFDSMAQGIILVQHFLSEALRLKTSAISDTKILKAQTLLDWLHKNSKKIITLAEAYQRGPNQIRDKKTATDALGILEEHGWIIPLPGGAEYDGMKRKVAWEVRS